MFLPHYKEYYERLATQSEKFIRSHCKAKGSIEKALSGKKDANFLNDYRYYAFTKSTKSLLAVTKLLEMGNYEDALILCRTIMECYLSQRYFDDRFDDATLQDMVVVPVGLNAGAVVFNNGVFLNREGEQVTYNLRDPGNLSLGKDKKYFLDMYSFLCEIAHCNFAQAVGFLDEGKQFVLYTEQNAEPANLFPLFVFSKIFENVVLLEYIQFDDPKEEEEDVELLKDLTAFLYDRLYAMCDSLAKEKISANHSLRETARNAMNSFKEQLGRVDKSFVQKLAKQYEKTQIEKAMLPALLDSETPSAFFEEQRQNRKFQDKFPELAALVAEDAWTRAMQALDRAAQYRNDVSEPYPFMLAVLARNFGKTESVTKFLKRVTNNDRVKGNVLELLSLQEKGIFDGAPEELRCMVKVFDESEA